MNEASKTPTPFALWQPWWLPWAAASAPPNAFDFAPQRLDQPINPGWSFGNTIVTINRANSSAPEIERAVVEQHSYGRQIGRMMDALTAMIETLPAARRKDERIVEFTEIVREVQAIKRRAELPQVQRLQAELEALRRDDPKAWAELSAALSGK